MVTPKDFVHTIGYGIGGIYGGPKAGQNTVWQRWKDFTTGFGRKHDPVPPETMLSVTNVRGFVSVQLDLHYLYTVLHHKANWNVVYDNYSLLRTWASQRAPGETALGSRLAHISRTRN